MKRKYISPNMNTIATKPLVLVANSGQVKLIYGGLNSDDGPEEADAKDDFLFEWE